MKNKKTKYRYSPTWRGVGVGFNFTSHFVFLFFQLYRQTLNSELFREYGESYSKIASELGVSNILEGSVQKQGNRFRVSVQLIDSEKEMHVWSEAYEGEYNQEIFTLQSKIAQEVAHALKAAITPEEEKSIQSLPTRDIRAYDFFIRGNHENEKYWKDRDPGYMKEALKLHDKALEIDPGFELAIRGKGVAYLGLRKYDSVLTYANKLLDIDPVSSYGYHLKGEVYRFIGKADSAIKYFDLAIINGRDPDWIKHSQFRLGAVYCYQKNDYRNGLPLLQKGFNINGERAGGNELDIGIMFYLIGYYDKVEKYFKRALKFYPGCVTIRMYSWLLILYSRYDEALAFLDSACAQHSCLFVCHNQRFVIYNIQKKFDLAEEQWRQRSNPGLTSNLNYPLDSIWLGYLYRETERIEESVSVLERFRETREKQYIEKPGPSIAITLSFTYAMLNDREKALKYLSEFLDYGEWRWRASWKDLIQIFPFFDNLREDPEFRELVNRMHDEKAAQRAIVREMIENGEIGL